jgi:hypothetical protein
MMDIQNRAFHLNDEVIVHAKTLFEITLLHNISYLEVLEDMVKFENKRYIENGNTAKIITDDKVKDALEFCREYHNEVTDNGKKTDELKEELVSFLNNSVANITS